MAKFHYASKGKVYGPAPLHDIAKLVQSGDLPDSVAVALEGSSDWEMPFRRIEVELTSVDIPVGQIFRIVLWVSLCLIPIGIAFAVIFAVIDAILRSR